MRICCSPASHQAADCFPCNREQVGGKGMFLQRMKAAGMPVPPFQCVTTQVTNALEYHPLDSQGLEPYFPGIGNAPEISLANIRERLNLLLPSEQIRRECWLAGMAKFIASDDFYAQVKDSEAARHIRDHGLSTSGPLIVRSSGINEDNYGDAQAGKYLSVVQGDEDVLRTCLKVMASAYRPEVCSEVIPQPMALIIQQCIDCQYGGVAMSFKSFADDTIRVEFTPGQPRGAVAGQSGNTPHRIEISRKGRKGADSYQYFPGTISSQFILHRNNNGYSEKRMDGADVQSNDGRQRLSDKMVSKLRKVVKKLEKLLFCPVDVEFAIDRQGRLFLLPTIRNRIFLTYWAGALQGATTGT
ncbi:PEP/pyruvate-binding domain-containing protein [Endozoicomonas sp. 8E]|uniref:PEP/pyruvate-binding domain-containing protein n=1 Tax=Endozoicomonas sp. 8E TaxID=3035692 RepID=UPI0029394782|nr:PEP/pyruvate-binding domain-containing protein [Endozoicomonas sp. 8E]WOG30416.1 PEP/pyruvate-binding domain-containing protein [Endozoicomonas sp. 8E]